MEKLSSLALNCWDWLGRVSWQVSVLILLVLLVQWMCRRWMSPAWRHSLWLLVVARLLLPSSIESRISVFNWLHIGPPSTAGNHRPLTAPISLTGLATQTASASHPTDLRQTVEPPT